MSKLYVLGSSGFIGSQLLCYLKSEYSGIVKSAGRENCDIYTDLSCDYSELVSCTESGDFVILLSSISSPDICKKQPELAYKVNVEATNGLISELTSKGVKVIFTSTDVVFGKCQKPVTDSSCLNPFGDYGEMKANVEASQSDNNLVKIIRFSYVVGLRDKYTSLLSEMALKEEEIEVFNGFERNSVVIDDVLEGIYKLIVNWDGVAPYAINFSGKELISRLKIAEYFKKYVCPKLKYKLVDAPNGFWDARPKTIEMQSNIFSNLLGREPMTIEKKLQCWGIK